MAKIVQDFAVRACGIDKFYCHARTKGINLDTCRWQVHAPAEIDEARDVGPMRRQIPQRAQRATKHYSELNPMKRIRYDAG